MTQKRKQEILDGGWGAVVSTDRVAHLTSGGCWLDDEALVPLGDINEARAHGYLPCPKCTGGARNDEDADEK